jgi:hypothetical protein
LIKKSFQIAQPKYLSFFYFFFFNKTSHLIDYLTHYLFINFIYSRLFKKLWIKKIFLRFPFVRSNNFSRNLTSNLGIFSLFKYDFKTQKVNNDLLFEIPNYHLKSKTLRFSKSYNNFFFIINNLKFFFLLILYFRKVALYFQFLLLNNFKFHFLFNFRHVLFNIKKNKLNIKLNKNTSLFIYNVKFL